MTIEKVFNIQRESKIMQLLNSKIDLFEGLHTITILLEPCYPNLSSFV